MTPRALVARVADMLAHNDECGPGPVSQQEYRDDAKALVGVVVEWIRDAYAEDAADTTFSYYGLALADDLEREARK